MEVNIKEEPPSEFTADSWYDVLQNGEEMETIEVDDRANNFSAAFVQEPAGTAGTACPQLPLKVEPDAGVAGPSNSQVVQQQIRPTHLSNLMLKYNGYLMRPFTVTKEGHEVWHCSQKMSSSCVAVVVGTAEALLERNPHNHPPPTSGYRISLTTHSSARFAPLKNKYKKRQSQQCPAKVTIAQKAMPLPVNAKMVERKTVKLDGYDMDAVYAKPDDVIVWQCSQRVVFSCGATAVSQGIDGELVLQRRHYHRRHVQQHAVATTGGQTRTRLIRAPTWPADKTRPIEEPQEITMTSEATTESSTAGSRPVRSTMPEHKTVRLDGYEMDAVYANPHDVVIWRCSQRAALKCEGTAVSRGIDGELVLKRRHYHRSDLQQRAVATTGGETKTRLIRAPTWAADNKRQIGEPEETPLTSESTATVKQGRGHPRKQVLTPSDTDEDLSYWLTGSSTAVTKDSCARCAPFGPGYTPLPCLGEKTAQNAAATTVNRGRGRPRIHPLTTNRPRGRPIKTPLTAKRPRGRPRKHPLKIKRPRGRPRKCPLPTPQSSKQPDKMTQPEPVPNLDAEAGQASKSLQLAPPKHVMATRRMPNGAEPTHSSALHDRDNRQADRDQACSAADASTMPDNATPVKRGRGRPRKYPLTQSQPAEPATAHSVQDEPSSEPNEPEIEQKTDGRPTQYPLPIPPSSGETDEMAQPEPLLNLDAEVGQASKSLQLTALRHIMATQSTANGVEPTHSPALHDRDNRKADLDQARSAADSTSMPQNAIPVKRGRGRPRKRPLTPPKPAEPTTENSAEDEPSSAPNEPGTGTEKKSDAIADDTVAMIPH